MSGRRLSAMPSLAAAVLAVASVAAVGCGKSGSTTQSTASSTNQAHTTTIAQPTAPLPPPEPPRSRIQAMAAGDALCASTAKQFKPVTDYFDQIQKSGASRSEINLKLGPVLEEIAGATRSVARQLGEMNVPPDDLLLLRSFASTLLEIAVIEEQLGQAYRGDESAHIKIIKQEIPPLRTHAKGQAQSFGFRVCASGAHPPVA
jgi:hypothetical protein